MDFQEIVVALVVALAAVYLIYKLGPFARLRRGKPDVPVSRLRRSGRDHGCHHG